MDHSSLRDVPDVRSLLATYGPASLFAAIEQACAEAAGAEEAPDEQIELWECAAMAARDAAAALNGEEEGASEDGDDVDPGEEPGDDEDEGTKGERPDEDEVAESDETRAKADSASGEAEDAPTPEPEPTAPEADEAPEDRREEAKTMARQDALGPRPSNATAWRARFRAEGGKEWVALYKKGDDGVDTYEWPIRACSQSGIRQTWPELTGDVVVQYICLNERGRRRPCGRSLAMHIRSTTTPAAVADAPEDVAEALASAPARPMAGNPPPARMMPPGLVGLVGEGSSMATVFSLLTYLEERSEKARAIEVIKARAESERIAAETRASAERHRAEMDLQMERERLASKERIAQIEASARAMGRGGGFDPEALVKRIEHVVDEKVQEAIESLDASSSEPMAMVPVAAPEPLWLTKLLEIAQPLVPLAVQALQKSAAEAAATTPLRVVQGGGGGGNHAAE